MSTRSKAEVERMIRFLLNLILSLRRLWGVPESEREQRLLGACLRQHAQMGEKPSGGSVGVTIDGLWEWLDSQPQHYTYAVTVLLELNERELDFVFHDRTLWQPAYWGDQMISGPPQWPLAYELLRDRLAAGQNLDQQIERDPEMLMLLREHGNVYWEHFCQVLRNLVSEELSHEFVAPLNWRRVAKRLRLSHQPSLSLGY